MKKLLLSATLALSIFAACQKEDMSLYLSDRDAVHIETVVGAISKSNPLGTDEQKKFNDGDRISVTNAGKTVVYKLQNGTWLPENASEYHRWDKTNLTFSAKYPADYSGIPDYQDTKDKLATADYMEGTLTLLSIPENRVLSIGLERKNVLVKIKILKYNDEYNEETDEIGYFYIGGEKDSNGFYDYEVTKPLLLDKNSNLVTTGGGKVGYTYSAIVSPNAKGENSDGRFINLSMFRDGVDLIGYMGISVNGIPELIAGKSYTFELIVGKTTAKIGSVTVNDWTNQTIDEVGETEGLPLWDGTIATEFAGGTGLETDPYLIATPAQLAYLAQQVNGGNTYSGCHFLQTEDFNLAGIQWSPIGNKYSKPFKGNFDGDNHEIFNLKVNVTDSFVGLFGIIESGSVKNVRILSGSVKGTGIYVGGIAGDYNNSKMENCIVSVNVSGNANVGGLVGSISGCNISNCHFLKGEIVGYDNNVGGIVGIAQSYKSVVSGCSANASVKGSACVGGLCGWFGNDDHEFSNCTMKGNVTITGNSCGGLVGNLYSSKGKFNDCQFEGSIIKEDNVYNTGIAIGVDISNVTFSGCGCIIDEQTNTSLEKNKVGYIENKSADNDKVRSDNYDYSDIIVTVK